MKKIFWIGLSLFLFGIWIFGFLMWQKTNPTVLDFGSTNAISKIFSFLPVSTPVPTPVPTQEPSKPLPEFIFYYDLSCPYCQDFSKNLLIPFFKANPSVVQFTILPFSKTTLEKDQNDALLLWCLLQKDLPITVLERTVDYQEDWKKWRDAQVDAEELKTCMNAEETYPTWKKMREDIKAKGIRGTPTIVVDGKKFEGSLSKEAFYTIISSLY